MVIITIFTTAYTHTPVKKPFSLNYEQQVAQNIYTHHQPIASTYKGRMSLTCLVNTIIQNYAKYQEHSNKISHMTGSTH